MKPVAVLILLLTLTSLAGGLAKVAASDAGGKGAPDLAPLIRQLASDDFEVREAAAKMIVAADLAALPAIKEALRAEKDLEVQSRLSSIKRQIVSAHPERLLKITLEGPEKPILLGVLQDTVKLKAWFENASDEPIVICKPVDGSFWKERDPKYRFALRNAEGGGYAEARMAGCGNVNSLREDDFVTLKPGEKVEVLSAGWGGLRISQFVGVKAGPHQVTLSYTMTSEKKPGGIKLGANGQGVDDLLNKSLKGTFVSAAFQLVFADPPPTEELLAILAGKPSAEVSLPDAIAALQQRREPKAVAPIGALVEHPDVEVRRRVASSLAVFKDPARLDPLLKACKDLDDRVRQCAFQSLCGVEDNRAMEALVAGLADMDCTVRQTVYQQLMYQRNLQPHTDAGGFNYNPYNEPAKQKPALAAWTKWWTENKEAFKFRER